MENLYDPGKFWKEAFEKLLKEKGEKTRESIGQIGALCLNMIERNEWDSLHELNQILIKL